MKKFFKILIVILIVLCIIFIIRNLIKSKKITAEQGNIQNEQKNDKEISYEKAEKNEYKENNIVTDKKSEQEKENEVIQNNTINTDNANSIKEDENKNELKKEPTNKKNENNDIISIKDTLAPSGFMGSSLYKVVLYTNGEVYVQKYNGEGYEDSDIIQKDLIAQNASSIYFKGTKEDFEAIVIKGSAINKDYSWIEFEK